MTFLLIFSILGLIAFMLSGAMTAIKYEMDVGGAIFLTAINGLGGGTIRDLLLQIPIFWMKENWYLYSAIIIGSFTFFFYKQLKEHISNRIFEKMLELFDILGTASFMIIGVSVALQQQQSAFIATILSVITCIGGSAIRDIICGEIPLVFRNELYATTVIFSSMVYIIFKKYDNSAAILCSCSLLITLRFAAAYFDLHLPKIIQDNKKND